jgi:hypothetical protein
MCRHPRTDRRRKPAGDRGGSSASTIGPSPLLQRPPAGVRDPEADDDHTRLAGTRVDRLACGVNKKRALRAPDPALVAHRSPAIMAAIVVGMPGLGVKYPDRSLMVAAGVVATGPLTFAPAWMSVENGAIVWCLGG